MTILEQRTYDSLIDLNSKIPEITLRDLFAMSSINGLIHNVCISEGSVQKYANKAYLIADAMLEARKK